MIRESIFGFSITPSSRHSFPLHGRRTNAPESANYAILALFFYLAGEFQDKDCPKRTLAERTREILTFLGDPGNGFSSVSQKAPRILGCSRR